ncbi:hypothetical protein GEMRC1_007879 [Eukaryota sp. GEM-RC1]
MANTSQLSLPVLLSLDTPQYPVWLTRLPRAGEVVKDESDSDPEADEETANVILTGRSSNQVPPSFIDYLSGKRPPALIRPVSKAFSEQQYFHLLEERLSQRRMGYSQEKLKMLQEEVIQYEETLSQSLVNLPVTAIAKKFDTVIGQIPRAHKARTLKFRELRKQSKHLAISCLKEKQKREVRFYIGKTNAMIRGKKLTREMQLYWRRSNLKGQRRTKKSRF